MYAPEEIDRFRSQVLSHVRANGPQAALDVASSLKLPILLCREVLETLWVEGVLDRNANNTYESAS